MANKICPLHDRVVVKRLTEEKASPGGIVIPDTAQEKPFRGDVIAVGDLRMLNFPHSDMLECRGTVTPAHHQSLKTKGIRHQCIPLLIALFYIKMAN